MVRLPHTGVPKIVSRPIGHHLEVCQSILNSAVRKIHSTKRLLLLLAGKYPMPFSWYAYSNPGEVGEFGS
jgi:hypothetical protein